MRSIRSAAGAHSSGTRGSLPPASCWTASCTPSPPPDARRPTRIRSPARTPLAKNSETACTTCAPGDTLVMPSLDRLGRSVQDLISIVSGLFASATLDFGPCTR
ncbi:recombinase family protein [Nocardia sp. NBC_01388]|uniref:recombinase family protein n=1 Tax=Nocardia sp. NBC_01388 TaxID=2903596 RepID=UPI0038708F1D